MPRRVILMGAGGRDFHDFNVIFRDNPEVEVIAFTATQIPGIEGRTYPPSLAGPRYPRGIPILAEEELPRLIAEGRVDEVVFAYSDVSYTEVMRKAAISAAAGADFTLLGPRSTMLESKKPVLAVCAVRTGAGKSQTSREIGRILLEAGLQVALLRHPMPYHDLDRIAVQRFASLADIDRSDPTVEEREEYERPVEIGIVVYAGVDYREILARAEREAEVIIWDGGNNDLPFIRPDLLLVVVDPLRAGDELSYHPGEVNLRMADVVIVNKVDSATADQVRRVLDDISLANPDAAVIEAASPVSLAEGPSLAGKTVLVVEDGPSITHGGMSFGAGTVAAGQAGVGTQIDPRPFAVGSIAETYRRFPHIGPVLPAMGYSHEQLHELERTINATDCDAVIGGTPIDLARVIRSDHPIRRASYEF
ncbi:MAG TPA: cyclic 2,3-diphosphoglycerate synthase, partial [Solirubrobacterales bacterium]|nr:cyclic 2,3-diphosphoglycerate synthase [Solirubrobacterales bacterium]